MIRECGNCMRFKQTHKYSYDTSGFQGLCLMDTKTYSRWGSECPSFYPKNTPLEKLAKRINRLSNGQSIL